MNIPKIPNTIIMVWEASSVYIFWIFMHYATAHLYPYFCAQLSLTGALTSPFLVMTPHCKAIHWTMQTSTHAIENMWVVLGTWLCGYVLPGIKKNA